MSRNYPGFFLVIGLVAMILLYKCAAVTALITACAAVLLLIILFTKQIYTVLVVGLLLLLLGIRLAFLPIAGDGLVADNHNSFTISRILKHNDSRFNFLAKKGSSLYVFYGKQNFYNQYDLYEGDRLMGDFIPAVLPVPDSLAGFIYHDYLVNIGADSICYLNNDFQIQKNNVFNLFKAAVIFKRRVVAAYLELPGLDQRTKSLLIALLTGDQSFMQFENKSLFRAAGVVHVLAISGLHVGILYVTLAFILGVVFRLKGGLQFLLVLFFLWFYAFLTGLSPSVVRASLMFSFIHFGTIFSYNVKSLNIVFAVAFFMLFWSPNLLSDIGFQLSFSAVIGILLFNQIKWLQVRDAGLVKTFVVGLVRVNCAAFLFTAPILSYHFGVINFTSIWASFFVVPLVTIAMYLGIASLFLIAFTTWVVYPLKLVELLFQLVFKVVEVITQFFMVLWEVRFTALLAVAILLCLVALVLKSKIFVVVAFSCLITLCLSPIKTEVKVLIQPNKLSFKMRNEIVVIGVNDTLMYNKYKFFYRNDTLNIVSPERKFRYDCFVDKYFTVYLNN